MKQKYRQNKAVLALRIKREGPREVRITVYDVMIGRMKTQRERKRFNSLHNIFIRKRFHLKKLLSLFIHKKQLLMC